MLGPTRSRIPRRSIPACASFVAALALALASHAEVDLASPYEGPPQQGPIPPLNVGGVLFDAPAAASGPNDVHEGRFTFWGDTFAPPGVGAACLLPQAAATETAPALGLHLGQALSEANASVSKLDGGTIQDFFGAFETVVEALGGDVDVEIGATLDRCVSWKPVQGRFLRSQWAVQGFQLPWQSTPLRSYHPQPAPFRELRQRGARLYCAARAAQFAQPAEPSSMGERVGFSVNVLGQTIDFLVVEPTLVLDGPERFTGKGAANGAQAFEIPLQAGTRITPIRGLPLPGFREIRVPVSLVTADTELRNASDLGSVFMGSEIECGWKETPPYVSCVVIPNFETKYRKDHLTITHLDLLRTAQKSSEISGETEVMRIGPVAVELGFGIDYFFGVASPGDGRVLDLPGLPAAREGRLWWNPASGTRWHDGPWGPRFFRGSGSGPWNPLRDWAWTVLPDGQGDPFWRKPIALFPPPPLDLRLLANDDHLFGSGTGLGIEGSLSGIFGGSFGPFTVELSITGSLTGTVTQHHVVSDSLFAQDQGLSAMTPTTGLTVRPRQTGQADLHPAKGTLTLSLSLPWPLDDIHLVKGLFDIKKVTLASYDSDDSLTQADERWNLRLGAGSARGAVTTQPVAFFHYPGGGELASFPVDVEACLADEAPNPPPPPPCEETPPQGAVPTAEVCIFGPGVGLRTIAPKLPPLPPNVCNDVPSWVSTLSTFSFDQQECLLAYLEVLCSPTSKQQPLGTGKKEVVAHVLDLLDPSDGQALADAMMICAEAFGVPGPGGLIDSTAIAEGFIETGICKADATILEEGEILGATSNPQQPPPVKQASACH